MFTMLFALALMQTPPALTVRLYYSYPTFDMLADGTLVVNAVPAGVTEIAERTPPQDRNDVDLRNYKAMLEFCATSQLTTNAAAPEIARILTKYKITCPK